MRKASSDSLEVEASIALLLTCGALFALASLFHYTSFVHGVALKNVAPEALDLVIGSGIISFIYFWLGISCWRKRSDSERFLIPFCFSGILVLGYFFVEVVTSVLPTLSYSLYINYAQFVSGYGSVTILAETLVLFFSYRVIWEKTPQATLPANISEN